VTFIVKVVYDGVPNIYEIFFLSLSSYNFSIPVKIKISNSVKLLSVFYGAYQFSRLV